MYEIIVYTTVTTLVVGVTTFLYKYISEYLQSNKKLSNIVITPNIADNTAISIIINKT